MLGKAPLFLFFIAHWLNEHKMRRLAMVLTMLNRMLFSCFIGPGAQIGKHVKLGYGGLGVVIHNDEVIHDHVHIGSGVTIGGRSGLKDVPVVLENCVIGAGAKILGPITIGKSSVIGANAVVIKDVPENSIAAGVPAKIIRSGIHIKTYHNQM